MPTKPNPIGIALRLLAGIAACAAAPLLPQVTESSPAGIPLVHLRVTQPAVPMILPTTLFGSFLEPIRQAP